MKRIVVLMAGGALALAAGCATKPPPAETPPPLSANTPPPAPPQPPPRQVVLPPDAAPPNTPAARNRAQAMARQASELLDKGEEDGARIQLEQAVVLDPENKTAGCLLRSIKADPVATLGRESNPYTVRPGETLGSIAKRATGDTCDFYLLARYNQIRVPRLLAAGQVIKIPGKAPLAEPAPAPKPRPEAAKKPDASPVAAPAPAPQPTAADLSPAPQPAPPDDAANRAAAERYHRNAQAAFSRQDLDTAIAEWTKALELDPGNDLYRARREQAVELQKKLTQIPK